MNRTLFRRTGQTAATLVIVWFAGAPARAQTPAQTTEARPGSSARTPWGDPDLQGTWDFTTITPLERPADLAGREFLSDREAADIETRINRQRFDTEDRQPGSLLPTGRGEADPGIYNLGWWWEPKGRRLVHTRRTSLVVDPPDGHIPTLTPQAQRVFQVREARDQPQGPEALPLAERCILGFNSGPPMVPGPYNNLVQLVQGPGYVSIINEMVHDVRIVALDGRPHLGRAIRSWKGNSRGRWEDSTLVVETRGLTDGGTATFGLPGLIDRNLVLVERFTRMDDHELMYRFTIDDPTVWTRTWSAEVPMTRIDGVVMEYACHEGNYGLANILSGARAEER